MATHRAGESEPPKDTETWTKMIRDLTPSFSGDEPWHLMVDDITKPAFMQPPTRSIERASDYKNTVSTPDELDMLVTSKNHDLKSSVAAQAGVDDWIFALITLQTMDGNPGRNPGISRMNSAYGSRPAFSITPDVRPGIHVKRDIIVLLEHRQSLLEDYPMVENGHRLLWTLPWDGTPVEALRLNDLDPYYLEICRRVRLCLDETKDLYVEKATAKVTRIEAKALNGITGDPWTPIDRKGGKSLTLANGGFTYKRTVEYLLSADWQQPALLKPTDAEVRSLDTMILVARGMVRGQGKTEGYYERTVPVRKKLQSAMLRGGGTDEIGQIATTRIEEVGKVQRILSHAIQTFLARGSSDETSPEHRSLARPWLNRLAEIVDARFFEDLQDEFEADDSKERERIHNRWLGNEQDGIVDHARRILSEALDSLPCPSIHHHKAAAAAEGLFEGRIRGSSGLPFLFAERGDDYDN